MPALLELNHQGKCIVQSIHDQMIYELKKNLKNVYSKYPKIAKK